MSANQYSDLFKRYPNDFLFLPALANSMWASDAIWRHTFGSTMLTYHQRCSVAFSWVKFHWNRPKYQFETFVRTLHFYIISIFPGANELSNAPSMIVFLIYVSCFHKRNYLNMYYAMARRGKMIAMSTLAVLQFCMLCTECFIEQALWRNDIIEVIHSYICRALQWLHNGLNSVSNHQPHHCLLSRFSGADQRKHQSSASLASVRGIYRGPHKWPVTRKMFPFDDVIM